MTDQYLSPTSLLDFEAGPIQRLVADHGWMTLSQADRIGAAYDFVRNEILFGYNSDDALPASRVLTDGYGQCNTKGTLLMALLRALGVAVPLSWLHHRQGGCSAGSCQNWFIRLPLPTSSTLGSKSIMPGSG